MPAVRWRLARLAELGGEEVEDALDLVANGVQRSKQFPMGQSCGQRLPEPEEGSGKPKEGVKRRLLPGEDLSGYHSSPPIGSAIARCTRAIVNPRSKCTYTPAVVAGFLCRIKCCVATRSRPAS